jgi:hypothetical protein
MRSDLLVVNSRVVAAAGVVSTLIATSASADFSSESWTLSQNSLSGSVSVGQTVTVGDPDSSVGGSGTLSSSTMELFSGDSGIRGITWYRAVASSTGTISVDYAYTTTDFDDYDGAGWVRNNSFTAVVTNGNAPTSGTITFSVNVGDTFGFGVFTDDGIFGSGTATFTNFVPAPGAIALLGAAGLVGTRRRRD